MDALLDALIEVLRAEIQMPAAEAQPASSIGDRLIEWIRANPGASPKRIEESGGFGRKSMYRALAAAVASGVLTKRGAGRRVAYFIAGGEPPESAEPIASPPPPGPRRAPDDLAESVLAFIRAHPSCRYKDLAVATGATEGRLRRVLDVARTAGAIRMEGTRGSARYLAVDAVEPPAEVEPPPRPRTLRPPPSDEAPIVLATIPHRSAAPPRPPARTDHDVIAAAHALCDELEAAKDDDSMHPIRLGHLLQAIVGEVRTLRPRVPDDHVAARRLDRALRLATAVRAERELPFIRGLKRDAQDDWPALARRARERVSAFDDDADTGVPKHQTRRPPPMRQHNGATPAAPVERFASLDVLARDRPVVLVGGIKKNEVIDQLRRRHGLEVEWVAAQGANARATEHFEERVRNGRVGAVVLLEGLFSHAQVNGIVDQCKARDVPFVYGGRAGTESLRSALEQLDRIVAERRAMQA